MKLLILIFSFINFAWACEVTLPHHIVFLNKDEMSPDLIKTKNCDSNLHETIHNLLTSLDGRVPSYQIKEVLSKSGFNLDVYPQSILIQHLSNLAKSQLHLPDGIKLKKLSSPQVQGAITLNTGDQLEMNCSACTYQEAQLLRLKVRGFDGQDRHYAIHADFKKLVKAYRLLIPMHSFSEVSDKKWVQEEMVEEVPHIEFISDYSSFKYHKTNKAIKAGELLRKSDFNAVKIVRAGLKTEVVLENAMVRIKTQGISRANGAIGDWVEVYHPQKNKKYQGKVIDINKVLVEL